MVTYKTIPLEQVYELRSQILRPDQPLDSCYYTEDNLQGVFHVGALNSKQEVIAIASFYPQVFEPALDKSSLRLRGMACAVEYQGQGVGSKLLQKGIEICKQQGADLLWCNARITASTFYTKLGFEIVGQEFVIENIGAHYLMKKCLLTK